MVISPEHPYIEKYKDEIKNFDALMAYRQEAAKKSDFERTELVKDKTGVCIDGLTAINPVNGKEHRFAPYSFHHLLGLTEYFEIGNAFCGISFSFSSQFNFPELIKYFAIPYLLRICKTVPLFNNSICSG